MADSYFARELEDDGHIVLCEVTSLFRGKTVEVTFLKVMCCRPSEKFQHPRNFKCVTQEEARARRVVCERWHFSSAIRDIDRQSNGQMTRYFRKPAAHSNNWKRSNRMWKLGKRCLDQNLRPVSTLRGWVILIRNHRSDHPIFLFKNQSCFATMSVILAVKGNSENWFGLSESPRPTCFCPMIFVGYTPKHIPNTCNSHTTTVYCHYYLSRCPKSCASLPQLAPALCILLPFLSWQWQNQYRTIAGRVRLYERTINSQSTCTHLHRHVYI